MEYAYPPLSESDDCELPDLWRHLPSLCLPDGAHNHEADTVFFHLPHLTKPDQTVYGVSCYRQIDAEVWEHEEMCCFRMFLFRFVKKKMIICILSCHTKLVLLVFHHFLVI